MTGLKDYKTQQKMLAVVLFADLLLISLDHAASAASFEKWIFALIIAILIVNISTGLMIEHKYQRLIGQMVDSKIEYGIEAGENLQSTIDSFSRDDQDD